MSLTSSRVVQWKQQEVLVNEIPIEGVPKGEPSQRCQGAFALVYAGHGRTNAGGSWTTHLPAISCFSPAPGGDHLPSVVATPITVGDVSIPPRPVILSAHVNGATITIWSLDPGGQWVPDVEFSWHCIVEGTYVK